MVDNTPDTVKYYRYEIYDEQGYYKGGIFRGMAYFLNLLYDRKGESDKIQTDYVVTNALSNAMIDMLSYPNNLTEGSDLTFYYTEYGHVKAATYIVLLKGIMRRYNYTLKEKVVKNVNNIVYQDEFQIAVEHRGVQDK